MKKILWTMVPLLLAACSDSNNDSEEKFDDLSFSAVRMQKVMIASKNAADSYRWYAKSAAGADSLISSEQQFAYVSANTGTKTLRLDFTKDGKTYSVNATVNTTKETAAYTNAIAGVDEYLPAPGQYVNTLPEYTNGDTQQSMNKKAADLLKNGDMVTLGAYGGHVIFHFDHTVVNVPGQKDFAVYGNAYLAPDKSNGGNAEPGIVQVAYDKNMNGKADDDEWYELAGSAYSTSTHNYQITYTRASMQDTPWTDNQGKSGVVARNGYHTQEYYPQWISAPTLSFTGTLLPANAKNEGTGTTQYWVLYCFDWGYTDNYPNTDEDKCSFDIAWAVDKDGKNVILPGIDFIRVYCGENQTCGWIGETSTEVSGAKDLHL